ncbi:MAG: FAD/NAD(P)-binding protein, partial [Planctomycetota bacterium]
MKHDWVIEGGGIHGVHLALRLLGEGGVSRDRLRIIDPASRLLARWRERTATTGMTHLRSTSVHHHGLDALDLREFAANYRGSSEPLFAGPYDSPSLALFNAHCDELLRAYGLEDLHLQDLALKVRTTPAAVHLRTKGGLALQAENIALALGGSEEPNWPAGVPREDSRIRHVFTSPQTAAPSPRGSSVAVVGGGITAAQIALRERSRGHRVALLSRHPLREHMFDVDAGWMGPKFMRGFHLTRDPGVRRELIQHARRRGSLPPSDAEALRKTIARGEIEWIDAELKSVTPQSKALRLHLTRGREREVDRLLLATGFSPRRPGGTMVDELIHSASLPVARCKFPAVDRYLRWHPRVFVAGALAELELGPTAMNIAGA